MKRQRLPISNPKPNPISKKKKKSEPHTLQPDSVIISTLERLRSQCSSSSSETHFEFDAASVSELDRIFLRDKDQFQSDDDVLDDDVFVSPFGGLVSGRIIITNAKNDYSIDCSKLLDNGITISPNPSYFGSFESDAIFILLVDDGDVFMQLLGDRFSNRFPSIIIWAEGQRHRATRDFLKRLKIQFKLPVFALLNSDPHGLQILSFYKCGSLDIKWLGLRPSDLDKHQISQYCRRPMTDQDVKTGNDLLKKDFVKSNKGWVMELEMMVKTRQKAEVLSLSSLGFQYLTEVYLPLKLQQQDWL